MRGRGVQCGVLKLYFRPVKFYLYDMTVLIVIRATIFRGERRVNACHLATAALQNRADSA